MCVDIVWFTSLFIYLIQMYLKDAILGFPFMDIIAVSSAIVMKFLVGMSEVNNKYRKGPRPVIWGTLEKRIRQWRRFIFNHVLTGIVYES